MIDKHNGSRYVELVQVFPPAMRSSEDFPSNHSRFYKPAPEFGASGPVMGEGWVYCKWQIVMEKRTKLEYGSGPTKSGMAEGWICARFKALRVEKSFACEEQISSESPDDPKASAAMVAFLWIPVLSGEQSDSHKSNTDIYRPILYNQISVSRLSLFLCSSDLIHDLPQGTYLTLEGLLSRVLERVNFKGHAAFKGFPTRLTTLFALEDNRVPPERKKPSLVSGQIKQYTLCPRLRLLRMEKQAFFIKTSSTFYCEKAPPLTTSHSHTSSFGEELGCVFIRNVHIEDGDIEEDVNVHIQKLILKQWWILGDEGLDLEVRPMKKNAEKQNHQQEESPLAEQAAVLFSLIDRIILFTFIPKLQRRLPDSDLLPEEERFLNGLGDLLLLIDRLDSERDFDRGGTGKTRMKAQRTSESLPLKGMLFSFSFESFEQLTIIRRLCNELSTVDHSDISVGSASSICLQNLDFLYNLKARDDQSENHMHPREKKPAMDVFSQCPQRSMSLILFAFVVRLRDGLPLSASTDFIHNKELQERKQQLKVISKSLSCLPERGTVKGHELSIYWIQITVGIRAEKLIINVCRMMDYESCFFSSSSSTITKCNVPMKARM
ncbi:hypothetical protein DNTS_022797, partial [Danionella cerebrum]